MRNPLRARFYKIKERCYNPNNKEYSRYGGRGIYICDEWLNDIDSFLKWANNSGYSPDLEIDRIDNDGPYSPENCRWVTKTENLKNMSKCRKFTYNGETKLLSDLCVELGLKYGTVNMRLFRGWSFERAIETEKRVWDPSALIGKKFGRLIVVEFCEERTKDGRYQYLCKCDCGNTAVVTAKYLRTGGTRSCGCIAREHAATMHRKNKNYLKKHENDTS